jgi:phosphatidate phosphatase APP1
MSATSSMPSSESLNRFEPSLHSVVYSTYAYLHPRKPVWRIPVQGRIFSNQAASFTQRLLLRGLERKLRLTPEQAQSERFRSRVAGFMTTPEPGIRIRVEHDGRIHRLRARSKSSGLFQGRLDIPRELLNDGEAPFTIRSRGDFRLSECSVFPVGTTGISVVSDIDDTIKLTEVTKRSRLLSRSFLEDFESIRGMAQVYREWSDQGALFHYVSSSPWQIYGPLDEFLREHQFPAGSMHLKWFRLRDEFFKRWSLVRRKSKAGVIAAMMKRMPYRRFLLIGDSGERDPEIYAKIASKFPYQVAGCLIRELEDSPLDPIRLESLERRCGVVPLTIFREPDEIADALVKIRRLN